MIGKSKSTCILCCMRSDLNAAGRPCDPAITSGHGPVGWAICALAPTLARVLYVVLVC